MSDLNAWLSQIAASVDALGPKNALSIDSSSTPAMSRSLALAGFPGVLPLWSEGPRIAGLLADPHIDPRRWAAVLVNSGDGITVATDARTLLPQVLVQIDMSNNPTGARLLVERWNTSGEAALELHEVLGGERATLEAVVDVASDPSRRKAFLYSPERTASFEAAHSALCRTIDRSAPFTCFADWLDASIAGQNNPLEDLARYGPWGRRVLCWAHRRARAVPSKPKPDPALLYKLVEEHAGIDSGVPAEPSWSVRPGGASGEAALMSAARELSSKGPSSDPVSIALARALTEQALSYRGLAHAEAVVVLDERGEPERAWGVMQSAAWWAARRTGAVPDAILEGARFLAERHGWADVAWVVARAIEPA